MPPTPQLRDYLDNTVPWGKQQEAFAASIDEGRRFKGKLFALLMQQRTGKTPVAIAKIVYHYERKDIDAALIVAMPSGVPQNWADEIDGNAELDKLPRMPARVKRMVVVWRASDAKKKGFLDRLEKLLRFDGLAILLVNGEACLTEGWRKYAARFLRARRAIGIVDETSLCIKAPGNKRTKVLNGARTLTQYRMILDGTPVGEGPMDLYSQIGWLSNDVLGQPTFLAFKHHFAEWEIKTVYDPSKGSTREYPSIRVDGDGRRMYQHLDELRERIDSVSFICARADCFDIPEKLYTPYRYEISAAQRRVYDALREEYVAELPDGSAVAAPMVLTRYLRLQQVLGNVWPSERELVPCEPCEARGCEACDGLGATVAKTKPRVIDAHRNPRLDALGEVLSVNPDPVIVWARFQHDIEEVLRFLSSIERTAVRYDGTASADEKDAAKAAFQSGRASVIVCNQQAAQRGLDFSAASAHIYYSNTFSGLQRQQTEDRTEKFGRTKGTGVIDIIAVDTIDEIIAEALIEKRSVAEKIMGRTRRDLFGTSKIGSHDDRQHRKATYTVHPHHLHPGREPHAAVQVRGECDAAMAKAHGGR